MCHKKAHKAHNLFCAFCAFLWHNTKEVCKVTFIAGFASSDPVVLSIRRRRIRLQKFFSAFPGGLPGVGLLLLRGFIALTLIDQCLAYIRSGNLDLHDWLVATFVVVSGSCLLVGFLTPIVAVFVGVSAIAFVISTLPFNHNVIDVIILAAALALLGPGAFSVDARLFGRREILIATKGHKLRKEI